MVRRYPLAVAVVTALFALAGCSPSQLQTNAYLLDDAQVGGDPAKSLKPVKNILVWPLENISAGSKAKGIETRFTGVLIDTLTLRGGFDNVVILEEDQAKDLMTRAGEELGLKKKPKAPVDGALIATKLGQLTGTECILIGRIEDYDEDKVEKATITVASASFNLIDAREKAYATMDSFTPIKRIWRVNHKRTSLETPFVARKGLDDTFRLMIRDVVDRLAADLGQGAAASGKALAKRVSELTAAAEKSLDAGEFDKATASWNEVLKFQPDNKRAKAGLEEVDKRRREAEERAKAAALKKQIEETRSKALEAEKAGELEAALGEWKKILELDPKHKEATDKVASLEPKIAAQKKKAAEDAERKAKEAAEKKAKEEAERKAREDDEKKAKGAAKEAAPAAAPTEAATGEAAPATKAEPAAATPAAAGATKTEAAPAPKAEPAAEQKAEEKPPAAVPAAGSGDLDALRNQAMDAFNKENYQVARDLWKQILEKAPGDKQAKEMLETTEMLLNALK